VENLEINHYATDVKQVDTTKLYPAKRGLLIMSSEKKQPKVRGFRPPMDEASDPSHDEHIKRLRRQEKI
jgi:hypothetical protein